MPYLNLDLDYFTHPKTMRLVGSLGKGSEVLPIRLWCHTGKYHAESGRLTGYSAREIESIAGWWGAEGAFVEAMLRVGFLSKDGEDYCLHEWLDHEGHLMAFKERAKLGAKAKWNKYRDASSIASSNAKDEPKQCPTPNLTIPNQTKEGVSVSSSNPTAEQLVEYWNRSTHPNYPRVKQITALRKTHINARLREHPDKSFWVDVVERLNKSTFLRGEGPARGNGKPWRADFDWVINPTNLAKIIEGNYDR